MMRLYRYIMSSFWKYFVTSPASEQGGPVLPETLATAQTGVEPSSSENSSSGGPMSLRFDSTMTSASGSNSYYSEASTGTDGPATQTRSNASTAPPPAQNTGPHAPLGEDIDCVFFRFQLVCWVTNDKY
ncbi:uncharacterized protein BJ212DRAFT_1330257 [Suillus subaureus]|uniref:Uncharacterized protein n=1 Tax=Suillus subaureus TaxID=48587 RepID=A0A9P7EJG2_9AGAM|nr:uncharacterized protein BJ212DRAFT_1330257 [Suillus subaureus]KAG1822746.1 hypothetical protein BJ212DRAFT_1330257 [Suillus subaureus]